jgi:hypothetical protein
MPARGKVLLAKMPNRYRKKKWASRPSSSYRWSHLSRAESRTPSDFASLAFFAAGCKATSARKPRLRAFA